MSTLTKVDLMSQASLLRNQALGLAPQYSQLCSQQMAVQREAYACANHCHDGWSSASGAAYDDPNRSQSFNGFRARQALMASSASQQRLAMMTSQVRSQTAPLNAQLLGFYNRLVGFTAMAGAVPGPLVAALAQARLDLQQVARMSLDMDVDRLVSEAQALVNRAAQYNQSVEADAPGQDVSPYARAVMADLQQAKMGWNQVATLSGQKAAQSLEAARLLRQVGTNLDRALVSLN